MKSVRFSDNNDIFIIPNNEEEDRSIGSMYYRNLIQNCENAESNIIKKINDNCQNKTILLPDCYPLTVRDVSIPWYRDDTVCKIWEYIRINENFAKMFYDMFDREINNKFNKWEIKDMKIILEDVHFYFYKVMRTS